MRQLSGVNPFQFEVNFGANQPRPDLLNQLAIVIDAGQLDATTSVSDASSSTFRVNDNTTNRQWAPSVAMDDAGDFVIAWANTGQTLSFFNTISFQQYDRNGVRVGSEVKATPDVTAVHFDTAVGMSPDGHFAVAWCTTTDPNYFLDNAFLSNVSMSVYDASGARLAGPLAGPGALNPTVAFDGANNVIVSGEGLTGDNIGGVAHDTWAIEYRANGSVLRPQFRLNGGTTANGAWPHQQTGAQVALDVDGDLTATYTGFGPDMSENVAIAGSYFSQLINDQKNKDLKAFFDPASDSITSLFGLGGTTGDIDAAIEDFLIRAANPSIGNATPAQIGRLRAILDSVAGLLRGEANGVMFSQWDADPTVQGALTELSSDSVANNYRDGHNTRMLLSFNASCTSGGLTLRLYGGGIGGYEDIAITPVYYPNNGPVNIEATRQAIQNALLGATRVGDNWPQPNQGYDGPVTVRTFSYPFSTTEFTIRQGTDWELPTYLSPNTNVVYEITFQGEAHDTYYDFYTQASDLQIGDVDAPWPQEYVMTYYSAGTEQYNASMAIQPDGSFVVAWTQDELYTNGVIANSNVYFREFTETADTAGPLATGVLSQNGSVLEDNDVILVAPGQTPNVTKIIVTFDEDMMTSGIGSVTNPANYRLLMNGAELVGGVRSVVYGMNMGFDQGLESVPRNKWEAVLTLDGDVKTSGVQSLGFGQYEIQLIPGSGSSAGLRDKAGNALGSSGYVPNGSTYSRRFSVEEATEQAPPPSPWDTSVTTTSVGAAAKGYPESRHTVAADADGDTVVVWIAPDAQGRDTVYFRLFNASGTAANNTTAVSPLDTGAQYANSAQRLAAVACDPDGDFVVTWTAYDNSGGQDVYARRFNAAGTPQGAAFRVNAFTQNVQKWSSVAMDAEGDFVIVWSSFGQEDPTLGTGYGVYARRYDAFGTPQVEYDTASAGTPKNGEFQVNVMTAGDQRFPSVAMDAEGDFIVTWTSSASGAGDDIRYRGFYADGSPMYDSLANQTGSLYGEGIANESQGGQRRYSDVAISPAGSQFVITWTSAGQDTSGDGVYTRVFQRTDKQLPRQVYNTVTTDAAGQNPIPASGALITDADNLLNTPVTTTFYMDVDSPYSYQDLNVSLTVRHVRGSDLAIVLIDPSGNRYRLVTSQPRDASGNPVEGGSFSGTIFDDQATTSIANGTSPYTGSFIPEDPLNQGAPTAMKGTWKLEITDQRTGPFEPDLFFATPIPAYLDEWNLDFQPIAAPGHEIRVNTSILGNQSYASVAMDHQGNFVVGWSGRGNQTGQTDASGTGGVFFQKFDATGTPISLKGTAGLNETRVNQLTDGNQQFPSVACDADGNFVVVWTGPVSTTDLTTDVYMYRSRAVQVAANESAPWVTDVLSPDGQHMFSGEVLSGTVSKLTVVFDELMSYRDGDSGLHSVLNKGNWRLTRGGSEVYNIESITFQRNAATRKYEATLTFNPPLDATNGGDYILTVGDAIRDGINQGTDGPNALDGDFNGTAGTNSAVTGDYGYRFAFSVAGSSSSTQNGAEIRVNQNVAPVDQFSPHYGMGLAEERSTNSLAVDHDGDFVVVWTRYGQDDPADSTGAGVYARVYDRKNNPLTNEILVNQYVTGDQRNASVACDATGDFVVVWESEGEDPNGTWGVYARRFSSVGKPLGNEFRVNTTIANDQVHPAVAMDDAGDFVVVWATGGQRYSYFNNIRGQLFDRNGETVGTEFLVTRNNLPGVNVDGSAENSPAVAMDPLGSYFVVAWDQITQQINGVAYDSEIHARVYNRLDANGNVLAPNTNTNAEFVLDVPAGAVGGSQIHRRARNPQIAITSADLSGAATRADGFIVAWESYADVDDTNAADAISYGIYYEHCTLTGALGAQDATPQGTTYQANMIYSLPATPTQQQSYISGALGGNQVNPSVAMDADGDYSLVWNGNGAQPHALDTTNALVTDSDADGIWIRNFHSSGNDTSEAVTVQTRVNRTSTGTQEFPTVGMTRDGSRVVVWSGRGAGDTSGIYFRRYAQSTDNAGPVVGDVIVGGTSVGVSRIQVPDLATGGTTDILLSSDSTLANTAVSTLTVAFDEDMFLSTGDADSVNNRANYQLTRNGVDVSGWIKSITYGLNPATNKYEAVLQVNASGSTLPSGRYELTVTGNLRDKMGNALGVSGIYQNGYTSVTTEFDVAGLEPGGPTTPETPEASAQVIARSRDDSPAVAKDAAGNYVVVWVAYGQTVGQTVDTARQGNIMAQAYDANGKKIGGEFVVNQYVAGSQINPDVAMDDNGNFVVVWSGQGQDGANGTLDTTGIYYRRFRILSDPDSISALDSYEQRANNYTKNIQNRPSVAMDPRGDFVIAWDGEGRTGNPTGKGKFDSYGVWVRRYSSLGQALGNQVLVNTRVTKSQEAPDVAMDGNGNFFVVWRSERQGSGAWSIYGQRYTWKTGARRGGETRLNSLVYGAKITPQVAMDNFGNSVVIWSGLRSDGYGTHVYKRQFRPNGAGIGSRETTVDTSASAGYLKQQASVSMSSDGKYFVVTWASYAQDEAKLDPPRRSDGVYGHMFYNATPRNLKSTWTDYKVNGKAVGDFRLNTIITGDQNDPAVAMDATGNFSTAWVGPQTFTTLDDDGAATTTATRGIWTRTTTLSKAVSSSSSAKTASTGTASAKPVVAAAATTSTASQTTASTQSSSGSLTDNQVQDAAIAGTYATPTVVGPTLPTASSGSSATQLTDSALADLLGAEGSLAQVTDLEFASGLPTGVYGPSLPS